MQPLLAITETYVMITMMVTTPTTSVSNKDTHLGHVSAKGIDLLCVACKRRGAILQSLIVTEKQASSLSRCPARMHPKNNFPAKTENSLNR